jgi:hypothetical protein
MEKTRTSSSIFYPPSSILFSFYYTPGFRF